MPEYDIAIAEQHDKDRHGVGVAPAELIVAVCKSELEQSDEWTAHKEFCKAARCKLLTSLPRWKSLLEAVRNKGSSLKGPDASVSKGVLERTQDWCTESGDPDLLYFAMWVWACGSVVVKEEGEDKGKALSYEDLERVFVQVIREFCLGPE